MKPSFIKLNPKEKSLLVKAGKIVLVLFGVIGLPLLIIVYRYAREAGGINNPIVFALTTYLYAPVLFAEAIVILILNKKTTKTTSLITVTIVGMTVAYLVSTKVGVTLIFMPLFGPPQ